MSARVTPLSGMVLPTPFCDRRTRAGPTPGAPSSRIWATKPFGETATATGSPARGTVALGVMQPTPEELSSDSETISTESEPADTTARMSLPSNARSTGTVAVLMRGMGAAVPCGDVGRAPSGPNWVTAVWTMLPSQPLPLPPLEPYPPGWLMTTEESSAYWWTTKAPVLPGPGIARQATVGVKVAPRLASAVIAAGAVAAPKLPCASTTRTSAVRMRVTSRVPFWTTTSRRSRPA